MEKATKQALIESLVELVDARLRSGERIKHMPVEGEVALLVDRLSRWFKTRNEDELELMLVDAVCLYMRLMRKKERSDAR